MTEPIADKSELDPDLQRRWAKIEPKLQQAKHALVKAGAVLQRRQPGGRLAWVVRYRQRSADGCCRRSIYIGPEELARKARELIQHWRAEAVTPEDRRRQDLLSQMDLIASLRGYSGRARRRLKATAESILGDRRAELVLVMMLRGDNRRIRLGKPGGRPCKSGLW